MANKKVLVADDEQGFVEFVRDRLEAEGFDVITAYNGVEALEMAHSSGPDLVILDILMPQMNGYDVCRKLKIDDKLKKIPVIMLSAKFQPNDIEFAKEMGADAYLTKPLELKILSDKINELLKIKKRRPGMKKMTTIFIGMIFAAGSIMCGDLFAQRSVNVSQDAAKAARESLTNRSGGSSSQIEWLDQVIHAVNMDEPHAKDSSTKKDTTA